MRFKAPFFEKILFLVTFYQSIVVVQIRSNFNYWAEHLGVSEQMLWNALNLVNRSELTISYINRSEDIWFAEVQNRPFYFTVYYEILNLTNFMHICLNTVTASNEHQSRNCFTLKIWKNNSEGYFSVLAMLSAALISWNLRVNFQFSVFFLQKTLSDR